MFKPEEFAKNQFILKKQKFNYTADKSAVKVMHVAFNVDDNFLCRLVWR